MPEVISNFLKFVNANSQPNGRQAGSHHAQCFFLPKFTKINSPRKAKNFDDKLRKLVISEFNRAQEGCGRGTCGKSAVSEWLKRHRPKVALQPNKTDYSDTCKFLKEKLSSNQAIQ